MISLLWLALLLPSPDAKVPLRTMGKVIDSVWSEPDGWNVVRVGADVLADSPDKHAVLVRTAVRTKREHLVTRPAADARAIAERIAGGELVWGKPSVKTHNKYDHTTTIDGAGANVVVRVTQRDRGFGKDLAWVEVAEGANRVAMLAAMEAARASELDLVDHACACGGDCDRKP